MPPLSRWHATFLSSATARAAWLSSTWPICKRKISGTMKSSTRVAKPGNRYASASNRACAKLSSGMRRRLIRLTFSRFCGLRNLTRPFPSIRQLLNRYNQQLKELAQRLNLKESLSSYVARHSWATAARKHNVPLSVISAGMGHTSERTTQIYLASLEKFGNRCCQSENYGCLE
ncbi:MAG: tyrosine-type recombinase/integrase [Alistipes indistinctus]